MFKCGVKSITLLLLLTSIFTSLQIQDTLADEVTTIEMEQEVEEEVAIPAPTEYAQIMSCEIVNDMVTITAEMRGVQSDLTFYDNHFYLFELQPYEDTIGDRTNYSGKLTKAEALSFSLPLLFGTEQDRLYSKFVIAVFDGEQYVQTSNTAYVTNPESIAPCQEIPKTAQTKKGLLIENTSTMVDDAFSLGINHVIVNIPFHHILGEGIEYVYDGKSYYFNKALMETYDATISRMSGKDMTVTAVILNGWNDATPQLVYPGVTMQPTNQVFYYGFHGATKESADTIKAIASFLAERYNGKNSSYGKVTNWIIGNEINNQQWNYMGDMSLEDYVAEYERAFRLFYTAIKSNSAYDNVYFSTDFHWIYDANGTTKYNAKDIIDVFNQNVIAGGNMDWGLAYHPYSIPLTEPEFWDDDATGLIYYNETSPVINMQNLSVLTDYFSQSHLLSPNGGVRSIILSEQGFTSQSATRGKDVALQSAAIAYAYYIADSNPHIDAFIMSRQVDAPSEVNASLSFGLWYSDMTMPDHIIPTMPKASWNIYKYIDDKNHTLEISEFAKEIIGIDNWSDVIPNFRWADQER